MRCLFLVGAFCSAFDMKTRLLGLVFLWCDVYTNDVVGGKLPKLGK